MATPQEQARMDEIAAAFTVPENQALFAAMVNGMNTVYDPEGLNMIVQVHSREDANGRSFVGFIEDNYSFPGKIIRVQVNADGSIEAPVLLSPLEE